MQDLPPDIAIRCVESMEEVEILRRIRNECRFWMTRDQNEISQERQWLWWANRPASLEAFLYCVNGEPIGFGLLRYEQEKWWATLGILPAWRSRGIGTYIYRHLVAHSPESVWIEVRVENAPSLKAAERAGFVPAKDLPTGKLLVAWKE